jgi:tRNA(fMet)-specific endonuclease VapC
VSLYLLDTNICIYYLKGEFDIDRRIREVGLDNCSISEITVAELKFGAANSTRIEENSKTVESFIDGISVLPIFSSLDFYARQKAKLRKHGLMIDVFDLLIGASAVAHSMILVTRNIKHFERIEGIRIENWIENERKV